MLHVWFYYVSHKDEFNWKKMEGRNKNDKDLVILILLAAYTHTREYVIIYFADLTCTISYNR